MGAFIKLTSAGDPHPIYVQAALISMVEVWDPEDGKNPRHITSISMVSEHTEYVTETPEEVVRLAERALSEGAI